MLRARGNVKGSPTGRDAGRRGALRMVELNYTGQEGA